MTSTEIDRKIRVIDAKVRLLQAQRAELSYKREVVKATPAKKREKPKKAAKKLAAKC